MSVIELKPKVKEFLKGDKGLYINGDYVSSESGKTFEVKNPSTEEVIANVSEASEKDVDKAVKAAKDAFDNGEWTKMDADSRSQLIYKFAELLHENREELAQLEALDNGKKYQQALEDDVDGTVQHFRYYAGWATKIFGKTTNIDPNYVTYTVHEPIGVVAQIVPWNYPLLMAAWKMGAALAAGCTIVLKPAEDTPLSILYAAQLFKEAGFPDGVVNFVPGYGDKAGHALVTHKDVSKVAFTGSTNTGRNIMKEAAEDIKSITLELGGKSPAVVLEDADLDAGLEGILDGTMYNSGQNCSATTRVYVHRNIYDEVIDALKKKAEEITVGDGLDEKTDIGPLVSEKQLDTVLGYIEKGKEEGAKLITGGKRIGEKGFFVEPTIFTDVTDDMTIAREEIFGPVMSVLPFDDIEEVITRANDSNYGLAASVWTENIKDGHYIASKLEAGTVWINDFGLELETMPFGGYKQSGIGRDMGGDYGIANYIEVKSVFVNMDRS
ncbi:aldehyde dehydrogenase family protein [Salinicoccus sp. YB14-2]|uniref:aldehyde dehydrogenase family protein n=1 Tax=Salinicoccus sp. YB14-2 TaxID=1572701 RepID=UPI00068E4330|nr:aldehyde dehydrogenase family protein [Salinicoccus sp. YB14-2]